MGWQDHVPKSLSDRYEIHEWHHAASILATDFKPEFSEICGSLDKFHISKEDVLKAGGNESDIPKRFSELFRPLAWKEDKLIASLVLGEVKDGKVAKDVEIVRSDTHKVDYLKGRVALDVEWNSKDQTFDRDLFAFRTFFEFGKISVGVLITRSIELAPWFASLGIKDKYGASTTHMGKLLPRLQSGRAGGCPVLAIGITQKVIKV
jgi:hypothetical protein